MALITPKSIAALLVIAVAVFAMLSAGKDAACIVVPLLVLSLIVVIRK